MNYYERHIGDYLKDTAHLSLLEHGIYGRLLDIYYSREAGFPGDQIARLVGAKSEEEKSALLCVLNEFFVLDEQGAWTQRRCDEEIARYQDKQRKAKASAAASWESRRAQQPQSERNATAMQTHSEGNAPSLQTQTPVTKEKEKSAPAALVVGLEEIPEDLLAEWKGVRSAKRAGKITQTVVKALEREAAKAGLTVEAAIRKCVERAWVGFEADWLKDPVFRKADVAMQTVPSKPTNGYLSQDHRLTPEEKAAADIVRRQVMASIKTIGKAA